ncbi:SEC-C domain-containing protein [Candidatus Mycobacterium methanotrophicum]|uniref:SEC-C metal-binding domain-containing protein n=1 Tax=Candidatus Mycobacterium methanotrophicum TaxID=2943498 RepID=A0ABY4QQW3_9MYCO|nr:SEC-C domain-containing protein [Candidatus Mycobacterium methanotrophicum]UQX13024.1 SEC-C metal-binding domain-containing protein [Candidatus Mycobacterium methanotrophicum]
MRALAAILAEHGPLHEDDIARRLQDAGVTDSDAVLDALSLEIECPAAQLDDDRWVWLPALLAGRVFSHRLGANEADYDLLAATPDLDPITILCEHEQYRRLADGTTIQIALVGFDDELLEQRGIPDEAVDPDGALLLEPGTLAALGATAGDLVGLRLTTDGLAVELIGTPPSGADAGARLADMLDADEPRFFAEAVWTVCVEDPAMFTEPLAPLREIADHHGLAHRGEWLAPAGFDFDAWDFDRGCALLARRHDLDPDDAFALYTLIKLHERMALALLSIDPDEPPQDMMPGAVEDATEPESNPFLELGGELGAALADPLLAQLLVAETVDTDPAGAAALGLFAEVLEPEVPRAARAALRWLRAVAYDRTGDIDAAERELLAAESMNTDWPLPLVDLARIASDRGDAERGLALLRRAGVEPDHPLATLLERHRAEPRRDLGRNEACWCGSGRKYKKCHLGREQLPLAERVNWLYGKACHHAMVSGWTGLLAEVSYERCRHVDPDDVDALTASLADPLVLDAVLFEGGAFAEFLQLRGSLLPDDERLLAQQWLLLERSVFEVEQVRPGQGVTVRDVRTGDTHEVCERAASRQLRPGQLICARAVPTGDSMAFFGGIEPVALHERDPLIELLDDEPDPVTLVAQLTRRFAPPTLVNTEGDPLAICEASVRVGDAGGIRAALDEVYDRADGEEPPRWFEHVVTDGLQRIRATLVLDDDTLRIETNSEQRMDRVLATLARLDPATAVLDDHRRPMRDTREAAALAKRMPTAGEGALDPDDPEVAAFLGEFIRDYETRWLDEPIPALNGCTPRQAADDPTRRGDLIKLLDSFPAGAAARGGMDADRLRTALGLG